jgi:hypothetical protein
MVGEPTNINDRLTQQRPGTRSRCPRQDRRNRLPERLLVRRRPVMSTSVEGRFLPFAACRKEGPQHPRLCRESTQQGSPAGAQGSAALGLIGWSNNISTTHISQLTRNKPETTSFNTQDTIMVFDVGTYVAEIVAKAVHEGLQAAISRRATFSLFIFCARPWLCCVMQRWLLLPSQGLSLLLAVSKWCLALPLAARKLNQTVPVCTPLLPFRERNLI